MLLMIKNHLNGTWFYELSDCNFRVYFKFTKFSFTKYAYKLPLRFY